MVMRCGALHIQRHQQKSAQRGKIILAYSHTNNMLRLLSHVPFVQLNFEGTRCHTANEWDKKKDTKISREGRLGDVHLRKSLGEVRG